MGELEFKQRWEFRRNEDNELDSSFDDSISSGGSLIRKQKLVSKSISLGDDETSEISRLKHKDNENQIPTERGQANVGKVKKRKTRKTKKNPPEDVEASADDRADNAPLDDLKNFMDSLLKDVKVTRESLLKWMVDEMQKLVADISEKPDHVVDEKVQMQKRKKYRKVQGQFDRRSNSEKCTQVQNNSPQKNKLQVPIQDEENDNKQHQNDFGYAMDRTLLRFPTGNTAAGSSDYFNALGDRLGPGELVELITSPTKKGDSLSMKPNLQMSNADQNVQVQSHSSAVLAVEAQKAKGGSLKKSAKGKKTANLGDHHQEPERQVSHGQSIGTAGGGSTNVEKPGSSFVQTFLSNPFGQESSSMYSMFPTFLTEPISHGPDASLYNYVQPRVVETKGGTNTERVNQMLEHSSNQGSFPFLSPEESIRRFALMGSRNMDCINQRSTPPSSSFGAGYPFPFHQGIDFGLSIPNPRQFNQEYPRQNNPQNLSQETSKPLGLKMNGGATKFSGGNYNLSEHIAAKNGHNYLGK